MGQDTDTRLAQRPDVHQRSIVGMTLLRKRGASQTITLDAVGTWIWSALTTHPTIDELVDDVAAVTGLDRAVATEQIEGVISALLDAGLASESTSDHS